MPVALQEYLKLLICCLLVKIPLEWMMRWGWQDTQSVKFLADVFERVFQRKNAGCNKQMEKGVSDLTGTSITSCSKNISDGASASAKSGKVSVASGRK